jgi:protein-S-isoprenylcysteine O-methyltransferase Ste14
MARAIYLLFGVLAYLVFFASFLYLVAFVGGLPYVPRSVDHGGDVAGLVVALVIDLGLVLLFGLQHSVMARKSFKASWTRIVPAPAERSMYVLFASLALIAMFVFWHPIPVDLWNVTNPYLAYMLWGLFGLGWLIVLVSTFLINHFELFGLHQAWNHARGQAMAEPVFRTPLFYARVRHPIYAGFVLAFWATPHMTVGHLFLAAGMTVYILIAIRHEERDLVALFGERYEEYRGTAGMLFPRMRSGD